MSAPGDFVYYGFGRAAHARAKRELKLVRLQYGAGAFELVCSTDCSSWRIATEEHYDELLNATPKFARGG